MMAEIPAPRALGGRPRIHRSGKPIVVAVRLWPGDPLYDLMLSGTGAQHVGSMAARLVRLAKLGHEVSFVAAQSAPADPPAPHRVDVPLEDAALTPAAEVEPDLDVFAGMDLGVLTSIDLFTAPL